jgi:AAA15 family ATPase/GTPase
MSGVHRGCHGEERIINMARHFKGLCINSYRGISNLSIDDLGDINIVLGKNNCGKTSLLEAIQILNRPYDFNNIVMVSRQRDRFRMTPMKFTQTQYSSFLNIFDKRRSDLGISLSCDTHEEKISVILHGLVNEALIGENRLAEIKRFYAGNKNDPAVDEVVMSFFGRLIVENSGASVKKEHVDVLFDKYCKVVRLLSLKGIYPLNYLSPIEHVINDKFNQIIRSKEMTHRVIDLLRSSFDSKILDLRTIEDDDGRSVRMIDHADLGYMPISMYGDGIKKVISIANAAATIRDGVLLIDEFETALDSVAMLQTFGFVMRVCRDKNIQLFLTTHSIEAIEKLLSVANNLDDIRVITLYKNDGYTTARVLTGERALYAKNELGLELR